MTRAGGCAQNPIERDYVGMSEAYKICNLVTMIIYTFRYDGICTVLGVATSVCSCVDDLARSISVPCYVDRVYNH